MRQVFTTLMLIFLGVSMSLAQSQPVRPSQPKIGELPIGKIITWKTEGQAEQFFVQRSIDGIYYITIGKVAFQDSSRNDFYTYLDSSLSPDAVYYRIAQASHDDGIQYSEATYYCSGAPNNLVLRRISDSKADKMVIVEFESAENGEGKYIIQTEIQKQKFTVYERPFPIFRGKNVLPIKIELLDPGFYQVVMTMGDEIEKFSFVKEKTKDGGGVTVAKK